MQGVFKPCVFKYLFRPLGHISRDTHLETEGSVFTDTTRNLFIIMKP